MEASLGLLSGLRCLGAAVTPPARGVKKSGSGYLSAREIIEAFIDPTVWTLNNSTEIQMAQELSADIITEDDD